ncbi:MAG: putative Ig domain-containing protein [Marinobacter sp.]
MAVKFSGCALVAGCGGGDSERVSQAESVNGNPEPAVALLPYTYQPTLLAGVESVQFSAEGLPAWASLSSTTGAITGTPGPDVQLP